MALARLAAHVPHPREEQFAPRSRAAAAQRERSRCGSPGPIRRETRPEVRGLAPACGCGLCLGERRLPELFPLRRNAIPARIGDDLRDADVEPAGRRPDSPRQSRGTAGEYRAATTAT